MAKSLSRKQKAAFNAAYRTYLLQWGKPKNAFMNRYNLFYDINYWDRHWLKKIRKSLARSKHSYPD